MANSKIEQSGTSFFSKVSSNVADHVNSQIQSHVTTTQELIGAVKGYDQLKSLVHKPLFERTWRSYALSDDELIPLLSQQPK